MADFPALEFLSKNLNTEFLQNSDTEQGIEMKQKTTRFGDKEILEIEISSRNSSFSEVCPPGGHTPQVSTQVKRFSLEGPWTSATTFYNVVELLFVMLVLSLIMQMFYPLLNGTTCQNEHSEKSISFSRCIAIFCKAEIIVIQTQEIAQVIVVTVLLHSLRKAKHLLTKNIDLEIRQLKDAHLHLQKVVTNAAFYFLYLNVVGWHKLLKSSEQRNYHRVDTSMGIFQTVFFWVSLIWAGNLVQMRVDALGRSSFANELESWADGLRKFERPQWACAGLAFAVGCFFLPSIPPKIAKPVKIGWHALRIFFWVLQSIASIIGVRAFFFTYRAVAQAKMELNRRDKSAQLFKDAEQAVRMQRSQLLGVIAMAASVSLTTFSTIYRYAEKFEDNNGDEGEKQHAISFFIKDGPRFINSLILGLNSVILSGALQIDFSICKDQIARAQKREQARYNSADRAKPSLRSSASPNRKEYADTVERLSRRGVSLKSIMDFYKKLGGELMEDFDAQQHSTADVVWQAIIPYSREATTACCNLMDKKCEVPDRMVTHTWSGLFNHLIASVIADALDEHELDMISYLLQHNISELERWVQESGNSFRRYWICAFSVNQHVSICKQPPSGLYNPCDCTCQVYSNKHNLCEMNKFKDMMAYVHRMHPTLEQVIAVDQQFVLFNRAWCIAEIHFASETGIKQDLKLPSRCCLELHRPQLEIYRVDDLQASRPEDKQFILDSIDDKAAFEKDVKCLLFDQDVGLVRRWESADSVQQMMNVGRLVRFVKAKPTDVCDMWSARTCKSAEGSGSLISSSFKSTPSLFRATRFFRW